MALVAAVLDKVDELYVSNCRPFFAGRSFSIANHGNLGSG
jgi:hypothetical protein